MAEGVDQAADAFRTEIVPESTRPRDESGRFTSGGGEPERMFGERPVEGDPETGDVSDGGEDQRLRQRERDEADGRRKRDAPSDDGRPPEKFGDKEVEEDGAEAAEADEAAEDDGWAVMHNGKPVEKVEVNVDGQTQQVSLNEAIRGYVREATFYKRMQKVSEAAQAVQQEAQQTGQQRDAYLQRIDYLERVLGSLAPPQPNWEQEFQADPKSAHEKLKAHAAIQSQLQWAAQEQQRVSQEKAAEYDRNASQYAHREFGRFVQEANIQDEKTLDDTLSHMRSYAKMRGFNEGEIATIYDSRMQLVLRDAALYHQSTAEQPKPVPAERGRTLVPGSSTPTTRRSGEVGRRSIDDAQKQLARSGRLDDAATVFQRILR